MLANHVENFIDHLETTGSYAPNTILAYENDLMKLVEFMEDEHQWSMVERETIEEYISMLRNEEYASATIARKIAVFKQFFAYLEEQEFIGENVVGGIPHQKVHRPQRELLNQNQIDRLIAVTTKDDRPQTVRDNILLQIIEDTSLPLIDLVEITVHDFDGQELQGELLSSDVQQALTNYINTARPRLMSPNNPVDALFLNHRGSALTRQGMWLIIKRCAEKAGLTLTVTPQILRQSFDHHRQQKKQASSH